MRFSSPSWPKPGVTLTRGGHHRFLESQNLAPMKVPRYVLFTDALPHTPSHRVAKHKLKALPDLMTRAVDTQAK